jgi:hypothetical protein
MNPEYSLTILIDEAQASLLAKKLDKWKGNMDSWNRYCKLKTMNPTAFVTKDHEFPLVLLVRAYMKQRLLTIF